jgi:hypothetical protein
MLSVMLKVGIYGSKSETVLCRKWVPVTAIHGVENKQAD